MTPAQKQLRDAETKAASAFMREKQRPTPKTSVKTVKFKKIKDSVEIGLSESVLIQKAWRDFAGKKIAAAAKAAAASKKDRPAADAQQAAKANLEASLNALLQRGELSWVAVFRGDLTQLRTLHGPAVAKLVRAMQALVRKRAALQLVAERRAEVETLAAEKAKAAAKAVAKAAAKAVAAGAALKERAQQQRTMALLGLCALLCRTQGHRVRWTIARRPHGGEAAERWGPIGRALRSSLVGSHGGAGAAMGAAGEAPRCQCCSC